MAEPVRRALWLVRLLLAFLGVVTTTLFDPLWPALALGLSLLPLLAAMAVGLGQPLIPGLESTGVIGEGRIPLLAAGTLFLLHNADPSAIPVAFLVLLAFELALLRGSRGGRLGILIVGFGVVVRVLTQLLVHHQPLRPQLLVLLTAMAVLLVAVAHTIGAMEEAWLAAVTAQERVALGFRETVAEVLAQSRRDAPLTHRDVMEAVQRICESDSAASRELAGRIAELFLHNPGQDYGLTTRELEVLELMAADYGYREVAERLYLSPSTVRNHAASIMHKLGAKSRGEAVRMARHLGIVRS